MESILYLGFPDSTGVPYSQMYKTIKLTDNILLNEKQKNIFRCGARDVISPGNLRSVIITQQEAVDLGLNPPDESRWNPHVSQAQMSRIANG